MPLLKRTYALPADTLERFEGAVAAGERSRALAEAIDTWVEERRRRALRAAVIEGCREMAAEYAALSEEFRPLEEEADRGADGE